MHLQKLIALLAAEGRPEPYACIADIVKNGISMDRFAEDERKANRNETTIFLATWCKHMGLPPDVYGNWLLEYTVDVLSRISSSKPSEIRHSTKSIITYVHRSDVDFVCNCRNNAFKAVCSSECPVYAEMEAVHLRNIENEKSRVDEIEKKRVKYNLPLDPETLPVTKRYRIQFDEAVDLIVKYVEEGMDKHKITEMLNDKGYKTITGLAWNLNGVSRIAAMKGLNVPRKKRQKSPETHMI
jgi:hypothetical protein